MSRLAGKVAVVTGGASGIGEGIVRKFAQCGAKVVIGDIREDKGKQLAEELGENVIFQLTDVTVEKEFEFLLDAAQRNFGELNCLVNNAGSAGVPGPIQDTASESFDATVELLLKSVFLGLKHAARRIKPNKEGTIINIASISGLFAGYGGHAYGAAKAAVIQLTRSVAMELGERGIRVNCICPGGIATGIFGTIAGLPADIAEKTAEAAKPWLAAGVPLKRAGLPEDVANAALWLASSESSFVNGHILVVDGGTTLGRMWTRSQEDGKILLKMILDAASLQNDLAARP
jgi:NAD(P)-dependent dehydrogenase (short-subunit alcohol dehydrogenase family)